MFQHQAIWLPDGEKHFPEWMSKNGEIVDGKGTYQIKKLRAAVGFCREFRTAGDVGAHVGLWAMHLAKHFERVVAFEPVPAFRECFHRNCTSERVQMFPVALGAADGEVRIDYRPEDSGGTHVSKDGDLVSVVKPLDSFSLQSVDCLKIDCEGYELEVLKGAVETLKRCHPCVIVEQKPHKLGPNFGIKGTPAVDFLRAMGAKLRREMGGDYILSWD